MIGGTAINLLSPFAYDVTSMKFLRIRHDSTTGNVVFETAPQSAGNANLPGAWTLRYQEPWTQWNGTSGVQLNNIKFEVRAGTSTSESNAPGTVSFDNFQVASNSLPAVNTPFGGTAIGLPGRIEAENFDNGGEGVAYHDTTPTANEGGAYRSEGVDICVCSAPNGLSIG